MMSIMPIAPWLIQLWDPSQWEAEVKSPGTLHAGIASLAARLHVHKCTPAVTQRSTGMKSHKETLGAAEMQQKMMLSIPGRDLPVVWMHSRQRMGQQTAQHSHTEPTSLCHTQHSWQQWQQQGQYTRYRRS